MEVVKWFYEFKLGYSIIFAKIKIKTWVKNNFSDMFLEQDKHSNRVSQFNLYYKKNISLFVAPYPAGAHIKYVILY